jgi:plasmid stability protein
MKQLLLRVDDDLHARLTARAKREHRSVNAIANEILSVIGEDDGRTEQEKVQARLAARGMLASIPRADETVDRDEQRAQAIESMRGAGELIDAILDEDRDRV